MATLTYQGHGSFRLQSANGYTIYVDPYAGEGYDAPGDLILVTHQHHDHNQISLCARKPDCLIATETDALKDGIHQKLLFGAVTVEAVQASNKNHQPDQCVGYIITIDSVSLYAAGDTSTTEQMQEMSALQLDYALLPCDGIYNMDLEEAAACAVLIGAKNNIPIHLKPGALFDRSRAESWTAPNRIVIEPGQTIELVHS